MAREIQTSYSYRVANAGFVDSGRVSQVIDQAAIGAGGKVQTISHTAQTAIDLSGVSINGLAILKNLDATHYLLWGPDNGSGTMVVCGKLKPGESFLFRVAPTVALWAKADTADVQMQVKIFED